MVFALWSLANSDHVCTNQEKALSWPLWNSTGVVQHFENDFFSGQTKAWLYNTIEGQEWQGRGTQIDYTQYVLHSHCV